MNNDLELLKLIFVLFTFLHVLAQKLCLLYCKASFRIMIRTCNQIDPVTLRVTISKCYYLIVKLVLRHCTSISHSPFQPVRCAIFFLRTLFHIMEQVYGMQSSNRVFLIQVIVERFTLKI